MTSSSPISFDSSEQTPNDYIDGAPGAWAFCDEEGGFNGFVDTYLSACTNGKDAVNEEAQNQDEGKGKKEGEVVTTEVNYSKASGGMAKEFVDAALANLKIPVLCPFPDPADAAPRNRSETFVEEDKVATKPASEVFEDSMNGMVCQCGTETLPESSSRKLRNLAVGSLRQLFQHQPPADSAATQGGSTIGIENTTLSRRNASGDTPGGKPGGNITYANSNMTCPHCRLANTAAATRLVANASEDSTKLTSSRSLPVTVSATTTAMTGPDTIGTNNQPPLPARMGRKMAKNVGALTMDDQLDARYKHLEEGTKLKAIKGMNGQIEYVEENDIPVPAEHIARLHDEARYEKMKLTGLPMTAAQITSASSHRVPRSDPSIAVEPSNDLQVTTSLPSSSARIRNFLFRGRQRARNGPTPPSMPPNPNNDPSSTSVPRPTSRHDPSVLTLEATLVEDEPEIPLYDSVYVQDEVSHTRWRKYQLCIAGVGLGLLLGIGLAAAVGVPLMSNSKNDASVSALTSLIDPVLVPPGPPSRSPSTTGSSFPSETPPYVSNDIQWDEEGGKSYGDASNDSLLHSLHLEQHDQPPV